MLNPAQSDQVVGQPLYDVDRDEIGRITQVYLHTVTEAPEWVTDSTDSTDSTELFVPLAAATVTGDGLSVPYSTETVTSAPRVQTNDGAVSPANAAQLYRHYGAQTSQDHPHTGPTDNQDLKDNDPSPSLGQEGMTRSEEQLTVATETYATQTVRLRKHIITEEKTITVSVRREVITVERAPVAEHDMESVVGGLEADPSHPQYETVLNEEQIIVSKKVVPIERVTLSTDLVTEQQEIIEQLRKEQIKTDTTDSNGEMTRQGTTKP